MSSETIFVENQVITLKKCISKTYNNTNGNIFECLKDFYKEAEENGVLTGKTILRLKADSDNNPDLSKVEIISRVDCFDRSCKDFTVKEKFELFYAVKIRHEGRLGFLGFSVHLLLEYLKEHCYEPITDIFCTVVRRPRDEADVNLILDIYVGTNPNLF